MIRLVYLHARNEGRASLANLAALGELAKQEILENDFYGQPGDVEVHYVDKRKAERTDRVLSLGELGDLRTEPVDATLERFAEAFKIVDNQRLAGPRPLRRPKKASVADADEATFEF